MDDFSDIKVGDVFFTKYPINRELIREVVSRVTKTQFFCERRPFSGSVSEYAFDKKNGKPVGSHPIRGRRPYFAIPATPEIVAQYARQMQAGDARQALRRAIGAIHDVWSIDDEVIRIAAILPLELTQKPDGGTE